MLSNGIPSEMRNLQTWTVDEYYTLLQARIQNKEAEAEAMRQVNGKSVSELEV